jgi:phage FluMu protein Com
MSKEKQIEIEVITYEQDRLNYFTDLMEKAQKSYDRLYKKYKDSPYLFDGTTFLSDAGKELSFYKDVVEMLKQGYRKQSEGEWKERPDLRGFVCSNGCGELLTELEEDAALPKFCPNCGTKMKNGTTIQEHVEILCKRLCRMKGGGE